MPVLASAVTLAPAGTFLGWTAGAAAVIAAPVALLGLLAPAASTARAAPPVTAVTLAVVGIFSITAANVNIPTTPKEWWPVLLRGGGACVGIAIALLLTSHTRIRLVLAPILGASLAAFADLNTATIIGILLVSAVSIWWTVQVARAVFSAPAVAAFLKGNHPVASSTAAASIDVPPKQRETLAPDQPPPTEPRRIIDQPWAAPRDA
jgi:hypothetical protein